MTTETFSFCSLDIIPGEIEELMGFGIGEVPEPFPGLINSGIHLATENCCGKGGYKLFPSATINTLRETITIDGRVFHPGRTVTRELKSATGVIVFLCTAGNEISDLAKQHLAEGDEMTAYILDVIGSVAADKIAGKILEMSKKEAALSGLGISDSFSPGYCNWNVAEQQLLFSLLPAGFCGISLSETSLMNPVKSVSGISGTGPGLQQKGYQCNWCSDKQCIYGKIRRMKNVKKNQ